MTPEQFERWGVRNELFAVLLMLPLCVAAVDDFPAVTSDEQYCMAEAMYFEARSDGWRGMVAVGVVIKNRVDDPRYPDTVCGVVRQGAERGDRLCQFSYFCDGKPETIGNRELWQQAQLMTDAVLSSDGISVNGVSDATHYHAMRVTPWWAETLERRGCVGDHIFYR